jgi:hypothetical protein
MLYKVQICVIQVTGVHYLTYSVFMYYIVSVLQSSADLIREVFSLFEQQTFCDQNSILSEKHV